MSLSTFAAHVEERLRLQCSPPLHRYLVVDQAALHGVDVLSELRWPGPATDLLRLSPPSWKGTASHTLICAPAIVLNAMQSRAWLAFAERWRYANAITYLEHSLAWQPLASALAASSKVVLPGNMPVLLRWFDNRVLPVLQETLHARQHRALFAGAAHMAFADRRGMARLVEDRVSSSDAEDLPLKLSTQQEAALIEAAEVDALISLLLDQRQANLIEMLPPEQYDCVHPLWVAARGYGIYQVPDQAAFCTLGLQLGANFHVEEPWAEIVRRAAKNQGRFLDALASAEAITP